jgi:hypothetical protein
MHNSRRSAAEDDTAALSGGPFIVSWAYLNAKGKQHWSDIFPDGKVPIQSIAAQQTRVEGVKDPESVFAVNWKALSESQQQAILEKLTIQKGAP